MRIRNHIRSNVIGYVALFFALTGTALAANTISSSDIINGEVKSIDIGNGEILNGDIALETIGTGKIAPDAITTDKIDNAQVRAADIGNNQVAGAKVADESLGTADLGPDSVAASEVVDESLGSSDLGLNSAGASEIVDDSVGSAEIAPNIVGADELDTVHEHTGAATDVVDGTEHDGIYAPSTATVSCGTGEDLLSVSVDWTDLGGHNEVVTSGVDTITRGEPDSATVRVGYDGGAGPATWVPVATCIF